MKPLLHHPAPLPTALDRLRPSSMPIEPSFEPLGIPEPLEPIARPNPPATNHLSIPREQSAKG